MKKHVGIIIGIIVLGLVAYGAVMVFGPTDPEEVVLPTTEDFATMSDQELLTIRDETIAGYAAVKGAALFEDMPTVVGPPGQEGNLFFTRLLEGPVEVRSTHEASGLATLYALNAANRFIRFTDFSITNGPDLRVLLVTHPEPISALDVTESFVELGSLKGTVGDQNYVIPSQTNLNDFQTVVIYSAPFRTIFAVAHLDPIEEVE